jgi:hypothetical protein
MSDFFDKMRSDPKNNPFPPIPEPTADPKSLLVTVRALREAVEMLIGRRGSPGTAAVLKRDL